MHNLKVRKNVMPQNPHPLSPPSPKKSNGRSLSVLVFDIFAISQTTEFPANENC